MSGGERSGPGGKSPASHLPRWVDLALPALALFSTAAAISWFALDVGNPTEPAPPGTCPGKGCPINLLYLPGTHAWELLLGLWFAVAAVVLWGVVGYRRRRRSDPALRPSPGPRTR